MTASEFWELKFGEKPQKDKEKLAIVMMAEYAEQKKNEAMNNLLFDFEKSSKEIIDMQGGLKHVIVELSFIEERFKDYGIIYETPF